jgi:hypothetical protein
MCLGAESAGFRVREPRNHNKNDIPLSGRRSSRCDLALASVYVRGRGDLWCRLMQAISLRGFVGPRPLGYATAP